jgi:hypothetical protein
VTDQPSITCPKCERVSYNPGDIKNQYCGACGYHDAPPGAPPGIPGVSPKFRQPTPAMQVVAELAGLDGNFHNWREGILPQFEWNERVERYLANMRELLPHLEAGTWLNPEGTAAFTGTSRPDDSYCSKCDVFGHEQGSGACHVYQTKYYVSGNS